PTTTIRSSTCPPRRHTTEPPACDRPMSTFLIAAAGRGGHPIRRVPLDHALDGGGALGRPLRAARGSLSLRLPPWPGGLSPRPGCCCSLGRRFGGERGAVLQDPTTARTTATSWRMKRRWFSALPPYSSSRTDLFTEVSRWRNPYSMSVRRSQRQVPQR